ncbi:FAD-binding oxidoreductase [Labrys monachus]|uniref:FAD/FMN-containing dehydrogenase n=1 Tax=Labrys monachus TaxID=217067 RepID=A0ABU0FIL1_9HYPH|nr:FAD-binding oxidoreductase [Labrys monachus]MDQ0394451.1 FAD/FMN-containing dehydrogenase [Labrys monachus]
MTDITASLRGIVGARHVRTGDDIPARSRADAAEIPPCPPRAVVLPADTGEVAEVLRLCHALGQPVVVQGGMTGLAGGAQPRPGEIALSLERLDGVEDVDVVGRTMLVRAGTPLSTVQAAAAEAGLFYGVDLGARGSCTIGGNVATNAGGIQVLRYGMTRRNVLGLEAVLADGTVVTGLNTLPKNNTGYDWTQLMIGSEGTLGVVTRVSLALQLQPAPPQAALCACASVDHAYAVLDAIDRRFPGRLMAFEAMWREYMDVTLRMATQRRPFAETPEITVLVEVALGEGDAAQAAFSDALGELAEAGSIGDALIAQSLRDRQDFWAYREANYEFHRFMPKATHFDISVAPGRMAAAIDMLRSRLEAARPGTILVAFGHLADCNLHLAVYPPDEHQEAEIAGIVYGIVGDLRGSISAEHGIGVLKRRYLGLSRSPAELDLMRLLKRALDPADILNRERVLPP